MSERWFVGRGEGGGEAGMVAVEKWEGSGEVVSRSIAVGKWREVKILLAEGKETLGVLKWEATVGAVKHSRRYGDFLRFHGSGWITD